MAAMSPDPRCPFCDPEPERILLEAELAYALEDIWPVSAGHALIIPRRHVADPFALTDEEWSAIYDLLKEARALLDHRHQPDGYNVGINAGAAAGQTVWHAHVHLIPRRAGDVKNPRGGVRRVLPSKCMHPGGDAGGDAA